MKKNKKVWAVGLWITELWQAGWEVGLRRDPEDGCWAVASKEPGPCLFSEHKKTPHDALANLIQKVCAYEEKQKA